MGRSTLIPTAVDARRARLQHDKRIAAARARLDAINAKVEKGRLRGADKALQTAAARFLPEGEQLPEPRELDLIRWPYAGGRKIISDVPQALRDAVLAEDVLCVWCREAASTTIDHVHPLNRGGSNHPRNLVGACEQCNFVKSDFLPSELGWVLRLPQRAFELAQGPGRGRRARE